MSEKESVQKLWDKFCENNPEINPKISFQLWYFGNTSEMAKELAELVISGKKTATASLAEVNKLKPEFAPIPDGYSIVTDFERNPLCVIQTTEIRHLPFDEVDAQFAFDEGGGDLSLKYWRKVHWKYFTKEAKELGIEFNEKSLICCERFKLLFSKL